MYKTGGVEFLTVLFEINWRKIQIEHYICVNIDRHLLKLNQFTLHVGNHVMKNNREKQHSLVT